MRILVVSHLWPRADWPHLGTFVAEQVAALAQKNEVSVLVPVDRTIRREELDFGQLLKGFERYRRRSRPDLLDYPDVALSKIEFSGSPFREKFAVSTAGNLARSLRRIPFEDFDFVHAHTVFPDGLACAYRLADETTPLAVTAHGSDVHSASSGVRKALNPLFRRADLFLPVSRFLGDRIVEYGADPGKIHVIPNGFPGAPFQNLDTSGRDLQKVAFLGRLGDVKRVDLLIQAMLHCRSEVRLEIAGDGPRMKSCQALVERLKLQERVRFLGMLDREQVPAFLAGAALLCLVSEREGWPTVLFEAMACGTPVLATAVGGVPEALRDARLGRLLPGEISPEVLGREMETALETKWRRDEIRAHALEHSWEKLTDELTDLYRMAGDKKAVVSPAT